MRSVIAICLSLAAFAASNFAVAADKPTAKVPDAAAELARLAGEYTAEYSARTGQVPADKEALKGLTLDIKKDEWIQNYRGDVAVYAITLELTDDVRVMRLNHKKVKAVRNCTYELKDGTLTVTEQLGEPGEFTVTVWKRKQVTAE